MRFIYIFLFLFSLTGTLKSNENPSLRNHTFYLLNPINPHKLSEQLIQTCDTTINDTFNLCFGDSVFLAGSYQTTMGTYTDSFLNAQNCDSVIVTFLNALPPDYTEYDLEICDDDSVFAAGAYRDSTGVYYDSLTNIYGCDSVIKTILTVRSTYSFPRFEQICQGDSLFVGGAFQTQSGVYYDTINTVFGCDSVVLTQLQVDTITMSFDTLYLCPNDSVLVFGQYVYNSGTYVDTVLSTGGCDSVLNKEVVSANAYSTQDTITICTGDSIFIGGTYQHAQGDYVDSLQSLMGCDSISNIFLKVYDLPLPSITFNDPMLSTNMHSFYQWHLNNNPIPGAMAMTYSVSVNGVYFVEVSDSNGCVNNSDTIDINNLSIDENQLKDLFSVIQLGDHIHIQNNTTERWNLNIFSITGQHLFKSNQNILRVPIDHWKSAGIIISVTWSSGKSFTKKLILFREK
ncbi:MAG: hypothetical protein MRY83_14280 [Flavobacteriales bacterium]|nr:hypothetical protein [Flavobacteriales bacterium]